MSRGSAHLRWLRTRVPDVRLFAPRVALAIGAPGGGVYVDERGSLPWSDLELEVSAATTARRLLAALGLDPGAHLAPLAVRTGPRWAEEDPALGPLQPLWIVVRVAQRATGIPLLRTAAPPPLVSAPPDTEAEGAPGAARDYIGALRSRIGHDRIFYPWAGMALRDDRGALLLVRLADAAQWHCPGGGMEPGETVASTAVRELAEETGLSARPGRLVGCWSAHLRSFANGDRIHGIPTLLDGQVVGGALRADPTGEIDAAGWYTADDLPPLAAPWDGRVRLVLTGEGRSLD